MVFFQKNLIFKIEVIRISSLDPNPVPFLAKYFFGKIKIEILNFLSLTKPPYN